MANQDQKLKISELDFAEIKANLKAFLKDQSEFTDFDFDASGMSTLLDILAYNTHYMAFYNNMVANEMFMDTAIFRDSVVSHAKMLGYTPISAKASRALVDVQLTRPIGDTRTSITMPKFTKFQCSPINSLTYTFVTLQSLVGEYDPTCGRFCFHDVYLYQGQPLTYTFTYDATNNESQSFELPDTGIDISTLDVIVQESATSLASEKYTLSTDSTQISANSAVFYVDEARDNKYKIYFGDGVIGKSLTDGNIVIVNYLRTEGAAANKANSFALVESVAGIVDHIIYPIASAAGGASPETVEGIRFRAPKAYVSNNRGVTKNDLISLISSRYPYFQAVNVWGGEENDPPVYGKVFVAAKPQSGYEVTDSEKNTVINDIIKPVSVVTVIPEFVDVDYNYLNIFANVYYDPTRTIKSQAAIKTLARNAILNYKATDLDDFNSRFKLSRMLRRIDDSEISISYSDADVTIQKRILPALNTTRNYTLNFGTQLAREDTRYKIYSAPGYTQYDDNFVLRTCFFEETPGSSSGVEKIIVVAAPNIYETTPTIEIVGDGVGATAKPVIVNGKLTSVIVDDPGIDYTNAKAYLYYNGELDNTVQLTVAVQNRFGVLRSYFFDNNNVKRTLNASAGVIDYELGKITLNSFNPVDIEDPSKILKITARPYSNNFESSRQRIITVDPDDIVSINITVKSVE
jgi:hypothetical protein